MCAENFDDLGYAPESLPPHEIALPGTPMNSGEYYSLGETYLRCELIDGKVLVTPNLSPSFSEVFTEIILQVHSFARASRQWRVFPWIDVRLDHSNVFRPIASVYPMQALPRRIERLETPPTLWIDALWPTHSALSRIERIEKIESFGVQEYWLVDPEDRSVRSWRRWARQLEETRHEGIRLHSNAIPGLSIALNRIRELG